MACGSICSFTHKFCINFTCIFSSKVSGLDRSWQRPAGVAAKLIDCKASKGNSPLIVIHTNSVLVMNCNDLNLMMMTMTMIVRPLLHRVFTTKTRWKLQAPVFSTWDGNQRLVQQTLYSHRTGIYSTWVSKLYRVCVVLWNPDSFFLMPTCDADTAISISFCSTSRKNQINTAPM